MNDIKHKLTIDSLNLFNIFQKLFFFPTKKQIVLKHFAIMAALHGLNSHSINEKLTKD